MTPPAIKLRNQSQINPPIIIAAIAELRAPSRKPFTKIPRLLVILKPIMGHRISEHMNQIKPIRSGEELLERIPVIANMTTRIVGHKGAKNPFQKFP